MPTTLRDIAQQANVSTTVVSRVLNGQPGTWASLQTRQRVIQVARELDYHPSASARALVTGKTMQLAVSPGDADWNRGRSGRLLEVRGLMDAAAAHRYRVLLLPSGRDHADQSAFERIVRDKGCDGLFLYAEQLDEAFGQFLSRREVPCVVVGSAADEGLDLPRVDHDNARYIRDSVAWLANRGHRRIAFVLPDNVGRKRQPRHIEVLRAAFQEAVRQHGADEDAALAPHHLLHSGDILPFIKTSGATAGIVRGLPATVQWRSVLRENGLRLPSDFALLAHLDSIEAELLGRAEMADDIAVHLHDPHEVGRVAADLLVKAIQCPDALSFPRVVLLAPPAPTFSG